MNADLGLDIPHAHIDLDKYCATLGHKANHSFVANAEWALVEHPRFGLIRGLASLEDIKKDDEILINYQVRPPQLFGILSQAAVRFYSNTSAVSIREKIPLSVSVV